MDFPAEANNFLVEQVTLIRTSYLRLLGKELIPRTQSHEHFAKQLFYAPFAVVSHSADKEPIFNYANLKTLELFEFSWEEFTCLPSRLSAEAVNQTERDRLLAEVNRRGYIDHYEGVRISKSGRRFLIKKATVWNLSALDGVHKGQAACFANWQFI
jgi:MEKHLA domain